MGKILNNHLLSALLGLCSLSIATQAASTHRMPELGVSPKTCITFFLYLLRLQGYFKKRDVCVFRLQCIQAHI